MNFRTSWQNMKSDPLHTGWLVAYTLVAFVVLLSASAWLMSRAVESRTIIVFPMPFFLAGGMLIADALARFSGEPVVHEWNYQQTGLLISFVVFYVLTLPVLLWGLKERARRRRETIVRKFPLKIVFALGFSLPTLALMLFPIAGVFVTNAITNEMFNAQLSQANKDYAMNTLYVMALKAQSFYHVPVADGGGGGRWMNIRGRTPSTVSLDEIIEKDPPLLPLYEEWFPQKPLSFRLEVFNEDSLAIWGIGTEQGDSKLFVNKDGQEGKVQVCVFVTPRNSTTRFQN